MNPRLQKITDELEKLKRKITDYQARVRDLERQKTELENADIVAMVRGIDISPDAFADFVRAFRERQGGAMPDNGPQPKTGAAAPDTGGPPKTGAAAEDDADEE